MRLSLIIMCLLFITSAGFSQQGRTIVSLDSRIGYSTNSYLNPFLGEWNPSMESAYNLTSFLGQSFWYGQGHSFSVTGGLVYEPFFNEQTSSWKGGIGLFDYNYRLSEKFNIGIESGGSYMQNQYSRTLIWIQPKFTWFVTPFTLFRAKVGPNFRSYQNFSEVEQATDRLDLYSLEFETWPSYQWRLRTGIYGALNTLADPREGFTTQASAGYHFRNGASISITGSMQQFQFDQTVTDGNGGDTFPPIGGGGSSTAVVTNTDRIVRVGVDGTVPLSKRFAVFAGVGTLYFMSENAESSSNDYKVSGGFRFNIEPKINKRNAKIKPEWNKSNKQQRVQIQYSGQGRLYLVGSFNNWNKDGIPLTEQSDNTYSAQLRLEVGSYEYKVLKVHGDSEEWLEFSNEVYTVDDGFGSKNAMLLVE